MYKYLIISIVFIFYTSCSLQNVSNDEEIPILNFSDKIDVEYLLNFFELDEIVPIETTDSYLVSDVKKVIRNNDKIILLSSDNRSVFVIDIHTGKILNHLYQLGGGPGEWNYIMDITFDDVSEQILILNDYKKLLAYSLLGDFLWEENLEALYNYMTYDKGKAFFYGPLDGYSSYPYLFKIYSLKDKTWEDVGDDRKVEFPIRSKGLQMVRSKQIWFTALLDFRLYVLDNNEIKSQYQLNIDTSNLTENLIKKSISNPVEFFNEVMVHELVYNVNSVRETANYLFFYTNQSELFIVNKEKKETSMIDFSKEGFLNIEAYDYYPHEGDDNSVMFIIPAERWVKQTNVIQKSLNGLGKQMELLDIQDDDNPILLFLKEK